MRLVQFLLNKIVSPLLVVLLASIVIGIASKIDTGDWREWIISIPRIAWIIFGVFISLWIIIIVIRNRVKQLKKSNAGPGIVATTISPFGWLTIGKLNYVGVVWRIQAPAPAPWESFNALDISTSGIEVETPPRCPKCETEIEQLRSFWGGYIWTCAKCGFRKRNRESYYKEGNRAEKIAKRDWEKKQNSKR